MTVSTTSNKVTYNGNGSTTNWSFSFPGVAAANILVFITDNFGNVTQLSPSQYTVTLNAPVSPNPTSVGGSVLYPLSGSPLGVGSTITILRQLATTQTTSLSNQSIIYPPVIEQALDYSAMVDQQDQELSNRAFQVPVTDPAPVPVPTVALRANQNAIFDASGNLTAGSSAGVVPISAAMQPVVNAATLQLARLNMGISPNGVTQTVNFTLSPNDDKKIFALGQLTVTIPAPAGFPLNFTAMFQNVSGTRANYLAFTGGGTNIIWPGQTAFLYRFGSSWGLAILPVRFTVNGIVTFYVDPVNGSDSNDGLAPGAGNAFLTIANAVNTILNQCDGNAFGIQLADGTHVLASQVLINRLPVGGSGIFIAGNPGAPGNCIITSNISSQSLFLCSNNGVLNLNGFQINGPNNCIGFQADSGGVATLSNFVVGTFGAGGTFASSSGNGNVNITSNYHIAGGAQMAAHLFAQSSGTIRYTGATTVTIDGAVTITTFMQAANGGIINSFGAPTFVNPGNVTGQKYSVTSNAVVNVSGATIPGTIAGTTGSGGQIL